MSTDNIRKSEKCNISLLSTAACHICTEKVAVHKKYNLNRHYTTRHAAVYAKYQGDEKANQVANLKTSTEATRFLQESNQKE